ncbi:DUF6286 domain-containing protein [Rhodococcus aetherivorans]
MPAAGRTPVATPAAGFLGVVLAVILIALGIVALHDAVIAAGWLNGPLWIDAAIDWIDGLSFSSWMIPAGIAALLVGLWMVMCALKPRRKTAIEVAARSAVWIDPVDLARAASHVAERVPGVLSAHAVATRRKMIITAEVTEASNTSIRTAIETAVRDVLAVLAQTPKITVRTRTGGR